VSGVYLTTFKFEDGFLPWGVGITNRPVRKRFMEHTRNFKNGEYNILDLEAASTGIRKISWKGWGWTEEKRKQYEETKNSVIGSAIKQFEATYIFLIELPKPIRLERLESALTDHLHQTGNTLVDTGMQLSRMWKSEEPISISFNTKNKIYGLPNPVNI
jgi:hypothetical protein